jgi:hypothetical protein
MLTIILLCTAFALLFKATAPPVPAASEDWC